MEILQMLGGRELPEVNIVVVSVIRQTVAALLVKKMMWKEEKRVCNLRCKYFSDWPVSGRLSECSDSTNQQLPVSSEWPGKTGSGCLPGAQSRVVWKRDTS